MTNNKHTATEIKIKTPYGIKNWSYLKRLMDNDVKAVNSHEALVLLLKQAKHRMEIERIGSALIKDIDEALKQAEGK